MTIKQLKEWCKKQADYYDAEMEIAEDDEMYDYCYGMRNAYLSVYDKISEK